MNRSFLAACSALAFTLLLGQITDKTTGQPLRGVAVIAQSSHALPLHAVTDAHGRFRLPGVRPGAVTLHYSSDDVPPQSLIVHVRGTKQSISITACSTTLDYSCRSGGGS
jgi:carboxypeptidase family protein